MHECRTVVWSHDVLSTVHQAAAICAVYNQRTNQHRLSVDWPIGDQLVNAQAQTRSSLVNTHVIDLYGSGLQEGDLSVDVFNYSAIGCRPAECVRLQQDNVQAEALNGQSEPSIVLIAEGQAQLDTDWLITLQYASGLHKGLSVNRWLFRCQLVSDADTRLAIVCYQLQPNQIEDDNNTVTALLSLDNANAHNMCVDNCDQSSANNNSNDQVQVHVDCDDGHATNGLVMQSNEHSFNLESVVARCAGVLAMGQEQDVPVSVTYERLKHLVLTVEQNRLVETNNTAVDGMTNNIQDLIMQYDTHGQGGGETVLDGHEDEHVYGEYFTTLTGHTNLMAYSKIKPHHVYRFFCTKQRQSVTYWACQACKQAVMDRPKEKAVNGTFAVPDTNPLHSNKIKRITTSRAGLPSASVYNTIDDEHLCLAPTWIVRVLCDQAKRRVIEDVLANDTVYWDAHKHHMRMAYMDMVENRGLDRARVLAALPLACDKATHNHIKRYYCNQVQFGGGRPSKAIRTYVPVKQQVPQGQGCSSSADAGCSANEWMFVCSGGQGQYTTYKHSYVRMLRWKEHLHRDSLHPYTQIDAELESMLLNNADVRLRVQNETRMLEQAHELLQPLPGLHGADVWKELQRSAKQLMCRIAVLTHEEHTSLYLVNDRLCNAFTVCHTRDGLFVCDCVDYTNQYKYVCAHSLAVACRLHERNALVRALHAMYRTDIETYRMWCDRTWNIWRMLHGHTSTLHMDDSNYTELVYDDTEVLLDGNTLNQLAMRQPPVVLMDSGQPPAHSKRALPQLCTSTASTTPVHAHGTPSVHESQVPLSPTVTAIQGQYRFVDTDQANRHQSIHEHETSSSSKGQPDKGEGVLANQIMLEEVFGAESINEEVVTQAQQTQHSHTQHKAEQGTTSSTLHTPVIGSRPTVPQTKASLSVSGTSDWTMLNAQQSPTIEQSIDDTGRVTEADNKQAIQSIALAQTNTRTRPQRANRAHIMQPKIRINSQSHTNKGNANTNLAADNRIVARLPADTVIAKSEWDIILVKSVEYAELGYVQQYPGEQNVYLVMVDRQPFTVERVRRLHFVCNCDQYAALYIVCMHCMTVAYLLNEHTEYIRLCELVVKDDQRRGKKRHKLNEQIMSSKLCRVRAVAVPAREVPVVVSSPAAMSTDFNDEPSIESNNFLL